MTATAARRAFPWVFVLLALLFAALMFAGAAVQPPPVRASAGAAQFDANSARARLARILGDEAPHPIDSVGQDATLGVLLEEIEALGLQPDVRETFACRPNPSNPVIDCMRVRNVVFAIGPARGPAIIAATHHDSVPAAPGASDAGIGVAAWLEVARILSQEPLTRRVIFLITDGEEIALMGAHVFAANDPDMQAAEALINLEARGTRGPALFFETNRPNADAIQAFAGAPRGMANSVMADVYEILPNTTDVTEFRRQGLDVINIALLDGLEDYHTPQDSLGSQDPRSLQHMGDVALHVTRTLAGAPDSGGRGDMVFTDLAGRAFVAAPTELMRPLLAVCALIAFATFWRAGNERRWRVFGLAPLALAGAVGLAYAIGAAFGALRPGEDFWFAHPEATRAWVVLAALAACAAALWSIRVSDARQAGSAAMAWFAALGLALSFVTPGISILFALPASVYALGALGGWFWAPAQRIGAGFSALLGLIVWAPLFNLVEWALGYSMPFANALTAALALTPLLGALVAAQAAASWRTPTAVMGIALAGAVAWAAVSPSVSPERPLSLNVTYVSDAIAGEGRVTAGSARRALPRGLAGAAPFSPLRVAPGDRTETWAAPAPLVQVARPVLEDVRIDATADARIWRATLRANGAYRVTLRLPRAAEPLSANVRGAEAMFADAGAGGEFVNLACQGRACDGAEIAIRLAPEGDDLDWVLLGQYPMTTAPPSEALIAERGPAATPYQFGDSILTIDSIPSP